MKEPIAIIGIGCRFPGSANDPDSYWKLLRDGVDAITEIPENRWDPRRFYDAESGKLGKTDARWGGFIEGIDQFDSQFFGISPREAARMDPQQRLMLEVAWEALEDAGLSLERIGESKTAVFVGISSYDYASLQVMGVNRNDIDVYTNTGEALSIAANRISYCFDFKGPSAAIDTACSSALVGVHLACQSIWHENCAMALAGGVNVLLTPDRYIGFTKLSMLSPDGRCKTFDARANGFVRSEGAGMVILKPLSRALADGDRVYALIRATAVNQDGHTPGMTFPSQQSQAALVREACREAGIIPGAIQYVEAHGTGTSVGDPIEARALGSELSVGRLEGQPCIIGSVKTNIGHLEPAAGIAGLIKVALALKHRQIPPNLHFREPNPEIPFEALRLRVARSLEPWPGGDGPALAGINSFGFGGTNAHAILEGPPAPDTETSSLDTESNGELEQQGMPVHTCHLLPLSARSSEALTAVAQSYQQFLQAEREQGELSLADLCFNASLRRTHHTHRLALVAHSQEELLCELSAFIAGESHADVSPNHGVQEQVPGLAFLCSGQGPQWWAMGRELLDQEPDFRAVIEHCDTLVRQFGGWSLWDELTAEKSASRMQETAIAQPAILAIQVALAALWQSWGIVPDAVVGHSVGEVAAGYIAGVLSLEDAVRVSLHRGRCMNDAPGNGRMLAVFLSLEDVRRIILPCGEQVSIAAINSPTSITLSGDASALEKIAGELQQQEVYSRFLQVQYAFHSYQMDPVKDPLLESLQAIRPRPARIPLYSTVTGQRVAGPEWNAEYWWHNVRQTVCFTDAVDMLLEANHRTFVELGPHPVLTSAVGECLALRGHNGKALPSLRRKEEERATMLRSLGALFMRGHAVTWDKLAPNGGRFVRLPSNPWQRDTYWHESEESRQLRLPTYVHPLLGQTLRTPTPSWQNALELTQHPYLADHRVRGAVVLPATAYLEMALAAGQAALDGGCSVIEDVQIVKACFLPRGQAQMMQTVVNPIDLTFAIFSCTQEANPNWVTHARGVLRPWPVDAPAANVCLDEIKARCLVNLAREDCYVRLKNLGLEYGPTFQGIQCLWQGDLEALAQIEVPEGVQADVGQYLVHPAILDACVQAIFGTLLSASGETASADQRGVYLPVEVGQVRVHRRLSGSLWCHAQLVEKNRQGVVVNLRVFDERGMLLVELRGLHCQLVGVGDGAETLDDLLYEYKWRFQPRPGQEHASSNLQIQREPQPPFERLTEKIQSEAQRLCAEQRVKERYQQLDSRRDALCDALIWQALEQLGADLRPGQCFTAQSLAIQLGIVPRHHRLLERFLGSLEENGLLVPQATRLHGVQPIPRQAAGELLAPRTWEVVHAPDCADARETWRSLVADHPAFIAELILLGRCGQHLSQVLRGEINPIQLIFPEGGLATAEHFYQDTPWHRFYHSVAQHALAELLEHFPDDRPIRILEIGAGTGGLTSYVLPVLPAQRSKYVFTDVSQHFFNKAQQKFRDFPFVEFQRLDIEHDPSEQDFAEHSFDLILAAQVLHATADLRQTLHHVRQLLAPTGLLLLLEVVEPPRWFDLVFGLLEGWWRFTDSDLRTNHPLLAFPIWQNLLAAAGFTQTTDVCLPRGEQPLDSAVILARGPAYDQATASQANGENESTLSVSLDPSIPPSLHPSSPGSWLLFADRTGVGEKLAELLVANGERCTLVFAGDEWLELSISKAELAGASGTQPQPPDRFHVSPTNREGIQQLLKQLLPAECPPWRGVIHLWNLDAPATESATTEMLEAAQTVGCMSVAHLLQVWTDVGGDESPRLWLITGGAHLVGARGKQIAMLQTPVWGLGRVIANEFPQFRCTLVDLSMASGEASGGCQPCGHSDAEIRSLFEELLSDDQEDEIALRGSARYILRYTRRPLDRPARRKDDGPSSPIPNPSSFRLEVSRSGTLDGLTLRSLARRQPSPGEVEIQVVAAGLNFSDIMKSLGLYPGVPDGPVPLGIECSGKITAVGVGVEDLQVGDEVVAIAPFSFSAFLTIPTSMVARKPKHLSFEEAATIPIAFLTADYALNYLGRMEAGERVLIHSATGGVGLAAIQLARRAGAEIFATAGTPEKREFLQALGIRHVMDSRSLAFADEIIERTDGRGVDLVLNSLAGEAIAKGIGTLADHGRFLEIGKRDIYQNSQLGLKPFRKNLSLIAIDVDRALRARPAQIASLFRRIVQDFEQGRLATLPHRVFPISNVVGAFRHVAQASHLGKVVISLRDKAVAVVPGSEQPQTFRADATYLITGGLGGFGLTVARWMVEQGARHLALVTRRGVTSGDVQRAVEALEQVGARVLIAKADVSREDETVALLTQIANSMPPLRGIVHAAMVLDDCLILNLNRERLQRVLSPKMSGAWNLHRQTLRAPLDFFVLFSTMSCVFGVAGQANYSAANTFLDALAHHRRSLGLPGLAINWGYLGNVGYVARNERIVAGFEQLAMTSFTPAEALALLGRLLQQDTRQVGIMRVNWDQQRRFLTARAVRPKFAELCDEGASDSAASMPEGVPIRKALIAAPPEQRRELLQAALRDKVARVLGAATGKIEIDTPLHDVGLDSLMAVELRIWIESELRLTWPLVELMRVHSVARLAEALLEQLSQVEIQVAAPAAGLEDSTDRAGKGGAQPRLDQTHGAEGENGKSVGPEQATDLIS